MAWQAERISPRRAELLGMLLAAANPRSCGGREVLRPIWAMEAMQRAYSMVRLVGRLEQATRIPNSAETNFGTALAAAYRSVAIVDDEERLPCSASVRDVVQNLVALFGPAGCGVTLALSVDDVVLPSFQRRALVLAASELVINAIQRACTGRISVGLSLSGRLSVEDDGPGLRCFPARSNVVHDLADLLQSEVQQRLGNMGGPVVQIMFPAGSKPG